MRRYLLLLLAVLFCAGVVTAQQTPAQSTDTNQQPGVTFRGLFHC